MTIRNEKQTELKKGTEKDYYLVLDCAYYGGTLELEDAQTNTLKNYLLGLSEGEQVNAPFILQALMDIYEQVSNSTERANFTLSLLKRYDIKTDIKQAEDFLKKRGA